MTYLKMILIPAAARPRTLARCPLGLSQEGELNPALRFANVTFWWLLVCGLQWLVAYGFIERYILEQPELRCVRCCSSLGL